MSELAETQSRSVSTDGLAESPEETFMRFIAHARRSYIRLWCLQGVLRGLLASAIPFAVVLWCRHRVSVGVLTLAMAYGGAALIIATVSLWWTRTKIAQFAQVLDKRFLADGKIIGAAEFLDDAANDPFKRLAVSEAGYWLATRPDRQRLWRWPAEVYAVLPAAGLIYLAYRFA